MPMLRDVVSGVELRIRYLPSAVHRTAALAPITIAPMYIAHSSSMLKANKQNLNRTGNIVTEITGEHTTSENDLINEKVIGGLSLHNIYQSDGFEQQYYCLQLQYTQNINQF